MLKNGDTVTIRDNSYTKSVIDGELVHESLAFESTEYVIVETGCKFPVVGFTQSQKPASFNDTVIQAIDSGKVAFIEERFLSLVPIRHDIIIDGQTIRISHESFLALRKQLL